MNIRFRKPSATGMVKSAFPIVFDASATRLITGTFYFASSTCFASVQLLSYMTHHSGEADDASHTYALVDRGLEPAIVVKTPHTADIDIDLIVTFQSQV